MTYLLGGYTSSVLQWLSLSAAWVMFVGFTLTVIGAIVLLSRTAIYKKSKETLIHIRPATVELGGLVVLLLGLAIAGAGADALSQPITVYGGGPSFQHCTDSQNVPCYSAGGSGLVTSSNSTLCTSTNTVCPRDSTSLGTWKNMPSATTELMGNTSYRGLLIPGDTLHSLPGLLIGLVVSCITLSNSVGATLELQDAVWDLASQTNTTNFGRISTGVIVPIDGVSGGCPSNNAFGSSSLVISPGGGAGVGQGFIFRVVGAGGGGTGDDPRFGSISVIVFINYPRIFTARASATSVTGFTGLVQSNLVSGTVTTVTYNWLATNITSTTCGTGDHCFETGTGTCMIAAQSGACTQAKTFVTAFTGTVTVLLNPTTATTSIQVNSGQIDLLRAQTLTV